MPRSLPAPEMIHSILNSYNFDISKCVDYFIEELGFDGAVVFRDKPNFEMAYHFHKSDSYLYMLDGESLLDIDSQVTVYKKWDFCIVPKGLIHAVRPGKWGKYIIATEDGNFESILID